MKISKYQASTMREALAKVKQNLGPDAMVIATRQVRCGLIGTGIEVTAAIDVEEEPAEKESSVPERLAQQDVERIMAPLRSELRSLRTLLRSHSESRSTEGIRQELVALRGALAPRQPQRARDKQAVQEIAEETSLSKPSQGRVVALVGPTGVGKTTTIAKLAARAALMERKSVALITLDTYRIGGEDQIRIFGELMGVPVYLVSEPEALMEQVAQLSRCERIFVDTAGRSPRDTPAINDLRHALNDVGELEVHLAIAAATQPDVIDSIYHHYSCLKIDRLIITKIDEAFHLDELVRAPARIAIPVSYITTGQAVPEDLEDATQERLLDLAVRGFRTPLVAA